MTAVLAAARFGHKGLVQELCETFEADFLHRKKVRAMQTVSGSEWLSELCMYTIVVWLQCMRWQSVLVTVLCVCVTFEQCNSVFLCIVNHPRGEYTKQAVCNICVEYLVVLNVSY